MKKILYELNSKEELELLISTAVQNALSKSTNQVNIVDQEELLTSDQICSWLKISRTQAWILSKKGILPFIRIGNQKRFLKSDVLKKFKGFKEGVR